MGMMHRQTLSPCRPQLKGPVLALCLSSSSESHARVESLTRLMVSYDMMSVFFTRTDGTQSCSQSPMRLQRPTILLTSSTGSISKRLLPAVRAHRSIWRQSTVYHPSLHSEVKQAKAARRSCGA